MHYMYIYDTSPPTKPAKGVAAVCNISNHAMSILLVPMRFIKHETYKNRFKELANAQPFS